VSDSELPKHAPYLVIGAGTAAYAAYRAIRAADATAKVCIFDIGLDGNVQPIDNQCSRLAECVDKTDAKIN